MGFSAVMLGVWVLTWVCVYFIGYIERTEAIATSRNTSIMVSAYVSQTLKAGTMALDSMRSLVSDHGIRDEQQFKEFLNDIEIHRMLKSRIVSMPEIDKLAFISAEGQVLNFSLKFPLPPIRVADRDYFIEQMGPHAPATSLSVVVTDRVSGRRTFYLAQKIVSSEGVVLGLAIAAIDADFVAKFFQKTALGDASAIFMTRADGTLLTGVGLRSDAYGLRMAEVPAELTREEGGHVPAFDGLPTKFAMTSFAAASHPVEGASARVTVVIGDKDIYAAWWTWFTLIMSLSIVLCSCIAFVLSRLLVLLRQLVKISDDAQAANDAKSRFITNMSHELRTPLNGILGMFRLLGPKNLDPEGKLFVETGIRSAEHLLAIVNDMLDLSKVEAGCMNIENAPFSVREMVGHAVSIMHPASQQRGNTIDVQVDEAVPACVVGDEGRWRQVLLNLLGNAIKFTENGQVAVRVEIAAGDDTPRLRFSVSDTGIGIRKSAQPDIFKKFFQGDSSMQRRFGGTGLGLTISSLIVRQLNGRIFFESVPGVGSLFCFEIPCVQAQTAGDSDAPIRTEDQRSLHILSAEDSPTNQLVIEHFLTQAGHRFSAAFNGFEAVEAASGTIYDAILMDVQMPEMDGIEATRRIRQLANANIETPVIMVTAHTMAGDREKFLAAGADDYLSKPVDPVELRAALGRVTARRTVASRPRVAELV
jgi:signal transduction histidine kinase/CheY-like chemotaxis protein